MMPKNWMKWINKGPKPVWIRYLFLIGFFSLLTRLVLSSSFSQTALLYTAIPYLVGLALYIFVPPVIGINKSARFGRHLIASLCVMLCTSAILYEGFICVLMFMPIYILFAGLAYAFGPNKTEDGSINFNNTFKLTFAPLLIIILSVEGLTDTTSFPRENTVSRSLTAQLSLEDIHKNLAAPIDLKEGRGAFLSLFPLPDEIQAGSLATGDIHKSFFTYRRWGPLSFNNKTIHKGETWLQLESVTPTHIKTKIVKDTSYFSHYLTLHGTQINLKPLDNAQTEITLTVHYRRDLDPAWYFGPMQKYAMKKSADYLLKSVIIRNDEKISRIINE